MKLLLTLYFVQITTCCCLPDVFQYSSIVASSIFSSHKTANETLHVNVWFDFKNKKMAVCTTSKSSPKQKSIYNYSENMIYEIEVTEKSVTCTKSKLGWKMHRFCLPNDSKFVGTTYFGMGNTSVTVNQYSFSKKHAYVSVQKDICVPLELIEFATDKTSSYVVSGVYFDFLPVITDPSVFTPPPNCTFDSLARQKGNPLRAYTLSSSHINS